MRPELIETCKGIGNTPGLFETVVLIDAACNHESFCSINFNFPYFRLFFQLYYSIYSLYGNTFDLLFMFLFIMSPLEEPLWYPFPTDRTVIFSVERWKRRGPWGKKWTERCLFSRQSRHLFPLINNMIKVFFPICTLIWRVNNCVSRQGKV